MSADEILIQERHMRVKRCRHGPMLYNPTDTFIGRSLDLYGEFSEFESVLFTQILKPGMVAIDVGANIGCFTVPMAKRVGPNGLVVAIEPQRVIYQTLCANVALNALENVLTVHAAAGTEEGSIIVPQVNYSDGGNFGGVELGGNEKGEQVPVTMLDALPLDGCHLIKIDVEGMECEVIEGAKEIIDKFQPVLYVENDRKEKSEALVEQLLASDYRLFLKGPLLFNPDNFFGNTDNVFGGVGSFNLICLTKSHNSRLASSIEITSPNDRYPPFFYD